MPATTSPFFGINYGWTTGESGWGSPINSNFKVLSFLGKGAVDSFVASLPGSPSDGDSVVLTTDNQFYVRLSGSWLFIPPQEGQEINETSTGKRWKYSGTWVEIPTTATLKTDLANSADPTKGSSLVGWGRAALLSNINNVHEALDARVVNLWEFESLVTSKPNPTDPKTWIWTPALQGALDSLAGTSSTSSGADTPTLSPGIVDIPKGEYIIGNIKWRSYVGIRGEDSSSTFLKPDPTATGFLFDIQNPTDRPRGVSLQGVSISPSRNVSVTLGGSRPVISALNIEGFEKQCSLSRIKIYNIDGTGIKTGDTQDMYIPDVEIRFVTKPLDINSKVVGAGPTINPTNAVVFQKLRIENSGQSEITGQRSTHFIGCKFEQALLNIVSPHGLDFIGCDWALTTSFAITVSGTNRGLRIIGGSTDTGLAIGGGANTAKFITSTTPVEIIGMMLRGHGPLAITGEVTAVDCIFCECDRPYASGGGSVYPAGNSSVNITNGTSTQPQFLRSSGSPYEVPDAILVKAPAANTWYQNITDRKIEVFLRMPYNSAATATEFQIKTRHNASFEYLIGDVKHPTGGGGGEDVISFTLLPGEEYWYNRSAGTTAATAMAFFR